ncbi:helix-turn-helix transcriptional regulator [Nonomuraea roseoviolacea subsp. roseoviolacea]|uniref:Transcriptional regulator with XRE-family HTH domain n=1 Tax=Nonomuraea roseoviolacea subsp. carminata TaxID=160689 RepID=A0ABT1K8N6_9ACTN|nr:helix-turn-helix transcriptional regulator [Nonomuraea roseoviolacea]MCP2350305.1 transcriptional regulator with XRE-family HTH domain [Nonomuraea roseoviolacea subsp. carminata]
MAAKTDLGEFLRARRSRIAPQEAGLPATTGRRRTPGLRREEVAMLAGVSIEYYTRLEQGKQGNPGPAVLEAIAGVLRLDEDARKHLFELANAPAARPAAVRPVRQVRAEVRRLLDIVAPHPAQVLSRANDLLAANEAGMRLLPGIEEWPAPLRNTARYTFLHPQGRSVYGNWDEVAAATVAHLRAAAGTYPDAPDVVAVVGELAVKSREFAALWERYDVGKRANGRKCFRHPAVGAMNLTYEVLTVARSDGHRLVVYQAEPGTPDHDAMLLLGMAQVSG